MPFEKSVLVPLNADETFALITQPDRLRRWHVVTARVDLRAGGEYRWTVVPGNSAAGTFTEVWWLAGCHVDPDTDVMAWIAEQQVAADPSGDGVESEVK